MFRIFLTLILVVSTTNIFAQPEHGPTWTNPNRSHNFYDIQSDFNDYWEGISITPDTPKEKRGGWKQFKRWEWFWEQRVYPTGEFPQVGHVFNEYLKYKNIEKKKNSDKTQSSNSWTHLGPKTASGGYTGLGRLNCVVEDPNYNGTTNKTIWVGAASGGIWKSTDGGNNWSTNTDDLAVLGIGDIAIDPNNSNIMYVATGDGDASDTYSVGVLKSTDGGENWNTTGFQRSVNQYWVCRRMIISHDDSDVLFVATSGGLYKSTNAGTNWTQEISGSIYDVKMHPTDPDIVYASTSTRFYKSTDGGDTFTNITSGVPSSINRIAIAVTPDEPNYVYILASSTISNNRNGYRGVYRSTNSGSSFSTRSETPNLLGWYSDGSDTGGQGWYDLALAVDPEDAELVIVGGVNMHKSTNGGSTWTCVGMWTSSGWYNKNGADEVHADHHMLYYPNTDRVYSANDGGLDISTNSGDDWSFIGSGLHITQFYEISVSQTDEDEVLCGAQDNSSFLMTSSSFGMTRATGDGMDQAINPSNGNTMFTASYFGNISRSYNGGASWGGIPRPEEGAWVTPYVIDPNNNSTLIAGYKSVWKSTNNGSNWSDISNFSNSSNLTSIHVAPANSDYIYTGRSGGMWVTKNGGTSWSSISLPNNSLTSITTNHSDPEEVWICVSGYSSGNKVYHSTNAGSSWTNISGSLPNVPCNSVLYQENTDDRIWVGTDIGIWYKSNYNSDWIAYNEDLPNVICNDVEIYKAGDKLRVGTYGRGLWEADLIPASSTKLSSPSNNSTDIELDADISWIDYSNEDSYILQVSKSSNFSTTVINKSGITNNTYDLDSEDLDFNTTYYWRVRGVFNGVNSDWSEIWQFKTKDFPAPTLILPLDNAINKNLDVDLQWNSVNSAIQYQIQLSESNTFTNNIYDNSITSLTTNISGLNWDKTYYWRVRAYDSKYYSDWSEIWEFSTKLAPPILTLPNNDAIDQSISLILQWNVVTNALNYDILVSEQSDFSTTILSDNVSGNEKTISNLNNDTKYFWKVKANNGNRISDWSDTWNFTTIIEVLPPDLSNPSNNSTHHNFGVTLDWSPALNALNYEVQVSDNIDFSTLLYDDNTSLTEFDISGLAENKTYHWKIRSVNNGLYSDWSEVWQFKTKIIPPTLSSPVNNSENQNIDLTLDWQSSAEATSYDIQVSNVDDFTTTIYDDNTINNQFDISNLDEFTLHYWRVRIDDNGYKSDWSETWQFKTKLLLVQPILQSPSNGAINQQRDLTLSWNSVTGATGYDIQVSEDQNFATTYIDESSVNTDKMLSNLDYFTTYYWRVRATNPYGEGDWSNVRSFTTKPQLNSPNLLIPIADAENQATTIVCQWSNVSGALNYQLQISKVQNFATTFLDETQTSTFKMITGLAEGTLYYWRVKAFSSDDESQWTTIREFTTEINLDPPVLVNPVNNASNQNFDLTLDWNSATNALEYDLQVSEQSNFASTIYNITTSNTEYNVTNLNDNTNYFWRVRSVHNSSRSDWSNEWQFTTKLDLLPPSLISPANAATDQDIDLILNWDDVVGADSYDIQLSTDPGFSTTIIDENLSTTQKSLIGLNYEETYYWRVRSVKNGGNTDWSSVYNFSTLIELLAPSLITPANSSINNHINLTLQWNSVTDADNYLIEVSDMNDFSNIIHTSTNTSTSVSLTGLNTSTKYYWRVKAKRNGEEGPWSSKWNFTTSNQSYLDVPDDWNFDVTATSHSLIVPIAIDPKVAGRSFQEGDAVGAFFEDNGSRVSAGYGIWDGTELNFAFYGDDNQTPDKDGFANGENLFFKIWDAQMGVVHDADFAIASGPSTFTNNGVTTLSSLNSSLSNQDIDLIIGWNMVSSFISPQDPDMSDVFSDISSDILIVKNGEGKIFVPSFSINTIGNWNLYHGYQVYATQSTTLSITGEAAVPENEPIATSIGWNLLAYLRNSAMSCIPALESLTDNNNLLILKNGSGKIYVPQFSINTIGDMQPGEGYQMYITGSDVLEYPANGSLKLGTFEIDPIATKLKPFVERTGNEMTLLLHADVPSGTEAGVYNSDDELIGSGYFNEGVTGITIWGDDEYTTVKDGALKSEQLTIKLLINSTLIEKGIELEDETGKMIYNQLLFQKGSIVSGKLDTKDIDFNHIYLRPQPAKDKLILELFELNGDKAIEIRNLEGKLLNNINTRDNIIDIDISELSNGTYILTIQTEHGTFSERFIKIK